MSNEYDEATEGGPKGPSGSVEDENEMEIFARRLGKLVIDYRGKLTPEARLQSKLRSDESRGKLLAEMVQEVLPPEVSPAIWLRWKEGGESPFTEKGIRKPVREKQGAGKSLTRGADSLSKYRYRVEKAKEELAFAEEALAYQEAMDKSILDWTITDHFIRVLEPVFAMGPAWTVMRILSGNVSDEEAARETVMFEGSTKEKAIAQLKQRRKAESKLTLETLDLWSGDEEFEEAMRLAIDEVVQAYAPRRMERIESGRRKRSQQEMMTKVHPEALDDAEDILGAYKLGFDTD